MCECKLFIVDNLVEATGVEPASGIYVATKRGSRKLSRVPETSLLRAQNGQGARNASAVILFSNPDVALRTSPLYDVLYSSTGEATKNGSLIN